MVFKSEKNARNIKKVISRGLETCGTDRRKVKSEKGLDIHDDAARSRDN